MKSFLKYTLATITGIIVASILFSITFLASLSAIIDGGKKPVSIKENSVLVLKAGVTIPDRNNQNPFEELDIVNMTFAPVAGLNEILQNIEKASEDDNIKGILIDNDIMPSGWATVGEIRDALEKFKARGKFVIAYADYVMTQECYYLSTVADKIYINPDAMVDFKGLSSEVIFFKKALEKIGLEIQVVRHGKFKGAVEPFLLDKLSKENRDQILSYETSIWNHVIQNISASRNISAEKLGQIADKLGGSLASGALSNGLVDGLIYRNELSDTLKALCGIARDKDINTVSMTKYSRVPDIKKIAGSKNRISVIYASGTIVAGKGNENNIGGDYYASVIRKERLDSSVKAIVLRVNSPGGSAAASDIMWKELEMAAKVKPVIISMGNYAASGGYYISAPATKIYASPTTISGSIGVFGLIPNAEKLLEQKLGLSSDVVNTNENSDFPSVIRPLSPYERDIIQMSIEKVYGDFVDKVSEGRNLDTEYVDSIGQGRVWSGTDAKNLGLIDETGGLISAIKGAAELAGVEEYSLKELPVIEDPYTKLISQLGDEIRMRSLKEEFGEYVKYYNIVKELKDMKGIQARLPYFIEIQ